LQSRFPLNPAKAGNRSNRVYFSGLVKNLKSIPRAQARQNGGPRAKAFGWKHRFVLTFCILFGQAKSIKENKLRSLIPNNKIKD